MESFYNFNGKLRSSATPSIHPDNRAFRYGEGLFETMRFTGNRIPLWDYHLARLNQALKLLGFSIPVFFSFDAFQNEIINLVQKNHHGPDARIRLTVYKGEGGIWDQPNTSFQYLIQSWPLNKAGFNENGLDLEIFPHGRKAVDLYSGLKCSNYLVYLTAAQYAKDNKVNECLVLNQYDRIADGTISNIFAVTQGRIITPPLSEGGIAGTMRQYLIDQLLRMGYTVNEEPLNKNDLLTANEIFMSNATSGVRWVKSFRSKTYSCEMGRHIFDRCIQPLFL